jgi:lipopolysaccharide transport system ATP-binding protein
VSSSGGGRGAAVEMNVLGKRFRRLQDRRSTLKELIVRGRAKQHEDFWALRGVSLTIPKGSAYGLIGHNGSGKSTMLKLVAGISRPSEGSVAVDGRLAALIELGAGFHPDLSGRDNIKLNGSILGLTRREIAEATGDIIEFSGLGDFIDEPVKNYSSGMYVRLGFSVAVHMRPDVLLIDEIIAVGDEDFQRKCFDHLYGLRRSGRTIVIVSHSTSLLTSFCDEVAWLDHGELLDAGRAQGVVDGYLGAVNAVEVEHRAAARPEVEASGRPGSGEVRLSSVEVIGSDGGPAASCVTGESLRLRLAYHARVEVPDPVFAVSFQHETGPVVTSVTTVSTDDAIATVSGVGRIDYVQEPCRLNPGNYRVDVSVFDGSGTHAFDTWSEALDLVVRSGAGVQKGGLVNLPDNFDVSGARRTDAASPA